MEAAGHLRMWPPKSPQCFHLGLLVSKCPDQPTLRGRKAAPPRSSREFGSFLTYLVGGSSVGWLCILTHTCRESHFPCMLGVSILEGQEMGIEAAER